MPGQRAYMNTDRSRTGLPSTKLTLRRHAETLFQRQPWRYGCRQKHQKSEDHLNVSSTFNGKQGFPSAESPMDERNLTDAKKTRIHVARHAPFGPLFLPLPFLFCLQRRTVFGLPDPQHTRKTYCVMTHTSHFSILPCCSRLYVHLRMILPIMFESIV